jgi:2-polyprenyl-3-methyl-5-hydroxy-6-metoxy-1,4-benzoquinol methylase
VAAERARTVHGIEVHVGRLRPEAFAGKRYDAVTLAHVLEHEPDPVALLSACLAFLEPRAPCW